MKNKAELIAKTIITHLKESKQLNLILNVIYILKNSPEYKSTKNHVVLTSATPLDSDELGSISTYLNQTVEGIYELKQIVDPQLVGGFTLQINDMLIDASVLGKINTIQHKLTEKQ